MKIIKFRLISNHQHNNLYEKVKSGDKNSLVALFKLYFERLCFFALKYLNDKEEAKDIVHDVFLKLWQDRSKINIDTSLKAYLFKAVQNNSIKYLNKQKTDVKHNYYLTSDDFFDGHSTIEDPYLKKQIYNAIDALPEKCKKITYHKIEGLNNDEIAVIMNIKKHTVENQLYKARQILYKKLKEVVPLLISLFFYNNIGVF